MGKATKMERSLKYEDNNVPSFLLEVSFENNFPK